MNPEEKTSGLDRTDVHSSTLFSSLGDIYILPVHLTSDQLASWTTKLTHNGAHITTDILSATLVLANLTSPTRVKMELYKRGGAKLTTTVFKLAWAKNSVAERKLMDTTSYVLFSRVQTNNIHSISPSRQNKSLPETAPPGPRPEGCLKNVRTKDPLNTVTLESTLTEKLKSPRPRGRPKKVVSHESISLDASKSPRPRGRPKKVSLESTSSEELKSPKSRGRPKKINRTEDFLRDVDSIYLHRYACQRPHPVVCENEELSTIFKKIRDIRDLTSNEVSVRAYSSAIASIRSYPYKIESTDEIKRLPGCGSKIIKLVQEYLDTGAIESETSKLDTPEIQAIQTLSNVWGVGGRTAYEWYHSKGWKSLDDIKNNHFAGLTKAQKCGVVHYDEFLISLNHEEVTFIGEQIARHARAINPDAQAVICGSYRRGLQTHHDVDIVLSVPNSPPGTHLSLLQSLIKSLQKDKYLSEVLTLGGSRGSQRSLLDVALVVWSSKPSATSPLKNCRVDIICADWSVVGCTVVGWTGGTTFERDLRMYAKAKGLKCTNTGITDRNTGKLLDTTADTIEEAEKRVFDVLELPYFDPELRNTG
ncbi:hypothetical protein V1512DRAFT_266700 [Lipomyces arxii]|uniref:uncharacterized protein n=1 Tax=Lipomyces arxii TaxID=56418 RepID=UPI0034CDA212